MKKLTAALIGAGDRGAHAYGPYAVSYPNELQFVAVCDPNEERSFRFAQTHRIAKERIYSSWEDIFEQPKLADIMVICTLDRLHFEPAIRALAKGYHVLLEKPMSPVPEECMKMAKAAEEHNRLLTVCHVLRYTPYWSAMKRVINEGKIGGIISIQLNENVGYLHMAHSFVRGNWNRSDVTSPMILQKSCHDMDILSWLIGEPCLRVSSFGSLNHFRKENAPKGSAAYCLDGCEVYHECPFYAPGFYLDEGRNWARKITEDTSREGIIEALKTGPYGKCVYQSDNNVVDHQVVNLEFKGGATAAFSLCGLTHNISRNIQVMGTKGEIRGDMETNCFMVYDFLTKEENEVHVHAPQSGHGGGDTALIRSFLHEVRHFQGHQGLTSARTSVESHLMAFAAEKSRLDNGKPVNLLEYKDQLLQSL